MQIQLRRNGFILMYFKRHTDGEVVLRLKIDVDYCVLLQSAIVLSLVAHYCHRVVENHERLVGFSCRVEKTPLTCLLFLLTVLFLE